MLSNSPISAMVPLSLFLVSVSPIAAELEPLEDGCLLQKTKEQQLLVKEEQLRDTPGYQELCGPHQCHQLDPWAQHPPKLLRQRAATEAMPKVKEKNEIKEE
jgi:hypothetical protein